MIASTNHLDQLDPGLSSRPSRFDRKYLFPLPSEAERTLYCDYWREKLKNKPSIKFPPKLSPAIAGITQDFSFAYLKEAFVATLLAIAGNRSENGASMAHGGNEEGGDLDDYELWREMKKQVKLLREDMDTKGPTKYHAEEPMDLDLAPQAWSDSTKSERSPTHLDTITNLPLRPRSQPRGNRTVRHFKSPYPTPADCDGRNAPLVTDDGQFLDSSWMDRTGSNQCH